MRHSIVSEIRSSMMPLLALAKNMRFAIILSLEGRVISLRSHLTLQDSLHVPVSRAVLQVNLSFLVNGLSSRFNLRLLLLGRRS